MLNPSEIKRLLRRMGLNVNVKDIDAAKVVIELKDGSLIEIKDPTVMYLEMPGNILVYQVQASKGSVRQQQPKPQPLIAPPKPKYTEDDIRLVMEQTGASRDEAVKALEESGGDLAAAIMKIQESKGH